MKKIAIIGGGIIGSTAAFYLSQLSDCQLTVFDFPQGQATRASAGIIAPWLSKRRNKKWYQLAKDGAHFYQKLAVDLALPKTIFNHSGALFVRPEETLPDLLNLANERIKEAPDMGEIELLNGSATKKKLPLLKEMPALYLSGGSQLDGSSYLDHVQSILKTKHVSFVQEYVTINKKADSWEVQSQGQTDTFDALLLAPGPHLKKLLAPLGYRVDIRPQKGQLLCFQTSFQPTSDWPVAMLEGEADVIPFSNGKILVGATHENDAAWDLTPTTEAYKQLTDSVAHFLDSSVSLMDYPTTYQVGTRAYTSDFAPFFGSVYDDSSLVVASGLGSSGLTTGPYIGYLLANYFANQQAVFDCYQKPLTNYLSKRERTTDC